MTRVVTLGESRNPTTPELRAIIEALPVAVYVTDREGRLTHFNAAAVEMAGRVPEIGTDQWCVSWKLYHADGTPMSHDQCPMAIAIKERRPVRDVEIVIEQPSGRRMHVAPYPTPLWNDDGELIGGVNMMIDITEAKRSAEAAARLAAIVSSSDDAIASKTLDGIVRTWNEGAERLFGYSAKEIIGLPINTIIPLELQDEEVEILRRIRRGDRIDHFDTVRVHKSGKRIDVSLTISPIRDRKGQVIGASKIVRDVTGRKRLEQALKDADRRKDEFMATLAHELRNPLAPLRSTLEILELADDNATVRKDARETMTRQVDRLVRLVDDLMDIARINQGKLRLHKEQIDVCEAIREAVEDVRDTLDAAAHEVIAEFSEEALFIEGDPFRFGQVITNLLGNAAKYTPRGGRISVGAKRDGGDVLIFVRDNGVGIPADKLQTIFEMFAQLDRTDYAVREGLGIGLTLVKSLVEAHEGSIAAKSEGLNKGSEFIVRFPYRHTASQPASGGTIANSSRQRALRILVVDDNEDAANALATLLETSGHDVRAAFDGAEALKATSEFRPEFALIDIGMPRMNGCEVAEQIRRKPWGKEIVLIAITGWGQESDRERTRAAGFNHHLTKPLTVDRLHGVLDMLSRRSSNLRQ